MSKKKNPGRSSGTNEQNMTLKDLLKPDILDQLKSQKEKLKKAEEWQQTKLKQKEQEMRRAEQKRLENDFEYLLENSDLDWKKYK